MAAKPVPVGAFQALVLWAVHSLRSRAYGMAISDFAAEAEGRTVHLAQVYTALTSLKKKGLVSAGEAGADKRVVYALTPLGKRVLDAAVDKSARRPFGQFVAENRT